MCHNFIDIFSLFSLSSDLFTDDNSVNNDITFQDLCIEKICANATVIDRHFNGNILLFKEALHISCENPVLNVGLKASCQIQLFR